MKYKFNGNTRKHNNILLRQIISEEGKVGGWIEKETNLSQYGNAWVFENAQVWGDAQISGDAQIWGDAQISGNTWVYENAKIYGDAQISGDAKIYENAKIYGDAQISGNAWVYENAKIYGDAQISGDAKIYGDAQISGDAKIYENAKIYGDIQCKFKKLEFYASTNTRLITCITTDNDKILFNIGCQKLITKEEFIDRIHNDHGGILENPHREFYLKILSLY